VLSLQLERGESGSERFWFELGVAWTPLEFVSRSMHLQHPFSNIEVDDDVLNSIFFTLTAPPDATRQYREATFAHWRDRAEQLEEREQELRRQAHPDVRNSIQSKRLLLFGEMLEAAGFPQPSALIHRMATGFPLVGEIEATGVFPEKRTAPSSTIQDLWSSAKLVQASSIAAMGPSQDAKLDDVVTEATRDEVDRGWLVGPFSREELDRRHGLWVPARRFGIWQGGGAASLTTLVKTAIMSVRAR